MDNKLFEELISPYATKVEDEIIPTYKVKYDLYVKKCIDISNGQVAFATLHIAKPGKGRPSIAEAESRREQKAQREAYIKAEKKRQKAEKVALLTPKQIAQREKDAKAYAAKKKAKEQNE